MTTSRSALDTSDLEKRVKQMYHEVATHPEQEFHFETGRALAERLGYPANELDATPAGCADSYAGVGYFLDLAGIRAGDTVLDLGSGSGMDSLLAARQAGTAGRVIGIDMTVAQLEKSSRLAADAGYGTVEFLLGYIEELPLPNASVDVVISNGVINLTPDKAAVFSEVARVLRPSGHLALADIVTAERLPEGVTCDVSLWAACIGGAMQADEYFAALVQAGFSIETIRDNPEYQFLSASAVRATQSWGVQSISLLAIRT